VKKWIVVLFIGVAFFTIIGKNFIGEDKHTFPNNEKDVRIIMKGTKYETKAYIIKGKEKGPTIFINGGIHGDEVAGFSTAEELLSYKLKKGKLIILPRANKVACEINKRTADFMEDLNRQFPGKKDGNDTEKIAFEITEFIKEMKPQILLDLHESRGNYREGRLGNSIIFTPKDGTAELVMTILERINANASEGNDFTFITNAPKGSINYETTNQLNIPVLTVETNRKLDLKVRIDQQLEIVEKIFEYYGVE
jgi:predicted deacylase